MGISRAFFFKNAQTSDSVSILLSLPQTFSLIKLVLPEVRG